MYAVILHERFTYEYALSSTVGYYIINTEVLYYSADGIQSSHRVLTSDGFVGPHVPAPPPPDPHTQHVASCSPRVHERSGVGGYG